MSFYFDNQARAFAAPYKAKVNFFKADKYALKSVEGVDDEWADFIIRTRQNEWFEQDAREFYEPIPDSEYIDWDQFDWSPMSESRAECYPHQRRYAFDARSPNYQISQKLASDKNQRRSATPFRTGKVEHKYDLYSSQTPRSRRSCPPDTVREPNHYWGQSLHSAGAPYSVKSVGRLEPILGVPSTLFYDGITSWELFQTQFTSFLGKHGMLWNHFNGALHCLRGALHGMAVDYFAQM